MAAACIEYSEPGLGYFVLFYSGWISLFAFLQGRFCISRNPPRHKGGGYILLGGGTLATYKVSDGLGIGRVWRAVSRYGKVFLFHC